MPDRQPPFSVLITAEHASCAVPAQYAGLFAGQEAVLQSHRAWDPGTADLAEALSVALDAPLLAGEVTRLLVDLNRSSGHPRHLSEFSRKLSRSQRQELSARYWQPHRETYRRWIEEARLLLHLACHSFTPELDGQRRNAEIGLLYDPARQRERELAERLAAAIKDAQPGLRVRMNYPYRGTANGMGQQHRRWFGEDRLITLELEVNASLVFRDDWASTQGALVEACGRALHTF
ncbi:MAG: N-formylglutamate amidohydrolase [Wenzhouxiangella sp.]